MVRDLEGAVAGGGDEGDAVAGEDGVVDGRRVAAVRPHAHPRLNVPQL